MRAVRRRVERIGSAESPLAEDTMVFVEEIEKATKGAHSAGRVTELPRDGGEVRSSLSFLQTPRLSRSSSAASSSSEFSIPSPDREVEEVPSRGYLSFSPVRLLPRARGGNRASRTRPVDEGSKWVTLPARQLSIVWGDSPEYWSWTFAAVSRFGPPPSTSRSSQVAKLVEVCWLDIIGRFPSGLLSPRTVYVAHLIFKLSRDATGFEYPSQEGCLKMGSRVLLTEVCVQPRPQERRSILSGSGGGGKRQVPRARGDGWMEVLIAEFLDDGGGGGMVEVSFRERGGHWKRGLVVAGIEIRPK